MIILKVLLYIAVAGAAVVGFALHEHVHSERWKVKTLADSLVVQGDPLPTSIADQQAIAAPEVGESVRRQPSERTLYKLIANLVEVKKEFDGDYHLVLEDPYTHLRMIAEIPDTACSAPESYRDKYADARAAIDRITGAPNMIAREPKAPTTLEITGLGFFDEPHIFTPNGMSPNCREIHPVLGIRLIPANESTLRAVLNGRPIGG